jgi:hypothetical protein
MQTITDAADAVPERVESKFLETKRALKFTGWGSGMLLLIVVVTLIVRLANGRSSADVGSLLAGLAVPTAAFAAGVLLGLLFAIPLISNGPAAPTTDADASGTSSDSAQPPRGKPGHNDSLVRVSQWLATVIVGASLVQLNELLAVLDRAGVSVSIALLGCTGACEKVPASVGVVGTALIIAFAIGGFLVGYLWTRVIFYLELWGVERATDGDTRAATARAVATGLVQKDPAKIEAGGSPTVAETEAVVAAAAAGAAQPDGVAPVVNPDDPLKGLFGGQSVAGGYRLSADVRRSGVPNFFSVKLLVSKTTGGEAAKEVEFFLHPTFPRNRVKKKTNKYGNATLPVLAWGAFTVGAELDTGVRLELDLSEVEDAPQVFRDR